MTDKPTPTTDLLKRCAEIYEWRSTGVLSGEALRDYAKRKWPDLHDTLQMAEHETVTEALALLAKWGQPAPATQQAAPKAAPWVGNSGFDRQTAADILSGKTVIVEALREFVHASRWAHDEKAALSATLLAMHGVLTSREAEIALLKKALLEAETAPNPAPAPLSDDVSQKTWALLDELEKLRGADRYDEDWDTLNKRDDELRAAIAAQGGKA